MTRLRSGLRLIVVLGTAAALLLSVGRTLVPAA